MAKTNIRNLGKFLDGVKEAVSLFDEEFYLTLSEYVVDRITRKARAGKRLTENGDVDLPTLSPGYVEQRKKWQKEGKPDLHELFRPSRKKSNLTVTGNYLESLRATKINRESRTLIVEPTGVRPEGLTNKKLAQYLRNMNKGYDIFGFDKVGRKVLKTKVLNEIRKQLRKKLLRK